MVGFNRLLSEEIVDRPPDPQLLKAAGELTVIQRKRMNKPTSFSTFDAQEYDSDTAAIPSCDSDERHDTWNCTKLH